MPPPSTPPKASPPTPCTASQRGRSHVSSCTPCSPAAGTPTTSTSKSSATATRTPSSDPTPSHPTRRPRRCNRSSAATRRRSPPAPLLRELNNPGARLFQAVQRYTDGLHVAAEQLLGPQTVAQLDQADQYLPSLTDEPAWPTLRAHLLALAAETEQHPLRHPLAAASGRDLRTAGDMAAVLYWRLPELTPTNPGPLPWLPGIPPALHAYPVWGTYLAKRSQLVADLADQVQDHARQGDSTPAWAAPGNHPSTALIGEIAVWRAANGINPQDPRPTGGGGQLETLPALWKQHLDRHIARATHPPADARADERQAARTALSPSDDTQRPYQKPERRPSGPSAPSR
jgi:hypothetical protein